MQDSTEEIARRILASVLRQLENGTAQLPPAQAVDQSGNHSANASPVIVIMLGDPQTPRTAAGAVNHHVTVLPPGVQQAGCGCQNNSHITGGNSLQSSHPGLERFDLPEDKAVSNAPRRCFMEPDRACVGSGACEMRGY